MTASGRAHPHYGGLDRAEAARLRREERLSNTQIAARLGVNTASIWRALGPAPDDCRQHRMWDEDDIRDRVADLRWEGYSMREIAAATGVPRSTLGGWVRGL